MTTRLFCTLIAALLLGFTSCTEKSAGLFGIPTQEDGPFVGDGGDNTGGGGTTNPGGDTVDPGSPGDENPDPGGSTIDPLDPQDPTNPPSAEPVPEPATFLLFGVGLTGLAFYRRRRDGGEEDAPESSAL